MTSYTEATGKRPRHVYDDCWTWYDTQEHEADDLPGVIFALLEGGHMEGPLGLTRSYPSEADALKAADEAYLKAVADGVIPPSEQRRIEMALIAQKSDRVIADAEAFLATRPDAMKPIEGVV